MTYLITGGAGFIGSHLAEELLTLGQGVTILDNLSTGRLENIAHLKTNPNFKLVIGSILDEKLLDKLVEQCQVVFHLAAAVGVELIVKKPLESLTTNIRGSELVLEMAYRYHRKVLITSTSEIYGKNVNGPLKETDDRILGSPLKTRWGYSTAKAVDEMLAYVYWKEKGLPSVIVRLFNTVGPRQTGAYGMVMPRFVEQALKNEPLTVYGSGKQTRSFCYIDDLVEGLTRLMLAPVHEPVNLGNPNEFTIMRLARIILRLTGSQSKIIFKPLPQDDPRQRQPDISRAKKFLKWSPKVTLEAGLEKTIEWFKQA